MRSDTPKLRSDITFTVREKLGDVVIADEALGKYHAVGELEYAIFLEMNGEQTLAQIARKISKKYDGELRPETVKQLVDAASDLGLLDLVSDERSDGENAGPMLELLDKKLAREGQALEDLRASPQAATTFENAVANLRARRVSAAARALHASAEIAPADPTPKKLLQLLVAASVESRRPTQSFMSYRIPLVAPDRFLEAVDRVVGWAVHPVTAGLILLGLGGALLALFSFFDDFAREMAFVRANPARFAWLALPLYLMNQATVMTHELSHGLVCKHYGGSVRRIGLLFRTVFFGAYCDVSSAYTFQERWKRAAVTAAGPLHDSLVFAGWIAAAVLTAPGTAVHLFCLLFMILWGTGFVLRLMPFNKDDLYFTISEAFNATNLLEKAIGTVKSLLARVLLGIDLPPPELHPRERRVVLIYGSINLLFSVWLFGRTLLFGLTFAVENLRGFGAVVLFLIVYFVIGSRVRALARYLWKERKQLARSRRFLVNAGVFSVAMVALPFMPVAHDEVFDCRVMQETRAVAAQVDGALTSLRVAEGDEVAAGQVLATLSNPALDAAATQCAAQLDIARAEYALVTADARDVDLAPLLAAAARDRQARDHERAQLERVKALSDKGMIDQAELSAELERAAASAGDVVDSAWAVREKRSGASASERAALEAQVRAAKARCDAIDLERRALELVAPAAGRVLSRKGGRAGPGEGAHVPRGEPLVTLSLPAPPKVELKLPADEAGSWVRVGAHLGVRLPGDQAVHAATLTSIAAVGAGTTVDAVARFDEHLDRWVHQAACRAQLRDGDELVIDLVKRRVRSVFELSFWTLW